MLDIAVSSAFLAGVLTFFAPCTLPLLPAFLGLAAGGGFDSRRGVFLRALGFVLGFLVVFMALGVFAGAIGSFFFLHRDILMKIGGVIVMVFALLLLNVIHIPALAQRVAPKLPSMFKKTTHFSTFFVGFAFALGWTPCLGPILGSILVLAGAKGTALSGAGLLFVYGLGIALPFLIFSTLLSEAVFRSRRLLRFSAWVSRIGGVFLLFLGFSLFFGFFSHVISFFSHLFSFTDFTAYMSHL
jgi:cytochrome c-type biogenesis protein